MPNKTGKDRFPHESTIPLCNFEKIILSFEKPETVEVSAKVKIIPSKSSQNSSSEPSIEEFEKNSRNESLEESVKETESKAKQERKLETKDAPKIQCALERAAKETIKEYIASKSSQSSSKKENETSVVQAKPRTTPLTIDQIVQNPIVNITDVIRIFVHGKYLQKPLHRIKEANFPTEIHTNLRAMNFCSIFRTQAHAWPHILEGRATFIINSEKSGKTFSYLPALLSNILYEEEDKEVPPKAQGPIGIIVVRSSRDVENIYRLCRKMVPREKMEIIQAFGKWNCENTKVRLLNGCDLLITTPPCFSRLAEGDVIRMFDKKRVKFLVLDDFDEMNSSFEHEMRDIIKTCTKGSEYPELNPQLIVTSSSWMDNLRGYMSLTCDPVMIFGSFVEAALLAKCRFTISKKSHVEKLETLLKLVKTSEHTSVKTLVVFNNQHELEIASNCFRNDAIGFLSVSEFNYNEETSIIDWTRERVGNMSIMLTTDEALSRLIINCVQNLIHFSLPNTMTLFSQRFATMLNRYTEAIDGKSNGPLKTFLMLDEDNGSEIPRLVNFLKTRRVLNDIPEDVNNLVEQLIEERELTKRNPMYESIAPICSSVFIYGFCPKISSCKSRHAFTSVDRPVNIPCDGLVKFELIAIKSPAHYYIKVLEYHLAKERKWISCEEKIKRIEESLESLQEQMKESALIQAGVKTHDICAVFVPKLVKWCRCKVLEKETTTKSVFKVIVHLIDSGERLIVKATDLKVLPSNLKTMDPLLTELRIVGLVPFDLDSSFDKTTTNEVEKFFTHKPKHGEYKILEVDFAVQNIIFAKTFEIRRHVEDLNIEITKFSLKSKLLKEDFCLKDSTVAEKLKMLLKRANIYVPPTILKARKEEVLVEEKKKIQEVQPRWKNLTVGSDYQVLMREFVSPNLFFTHLDSSYNKVLPKLMQPVNECKARTPIDKLKIDDYCLVGMKNQNARRGVIKKVKESSVKVFLLDQGETIKCKRSDVYQLPASIINIVPFQAIQCRLAGVKPKHGLDWNSQSAKAIKEFVNEICYEQVIKLRVVARHNNVYDVLLFHPISGESLHKIAVEKNLADLANIEVEENSDQHIESSDLSSNSDQNVAIDRKTAEKNLLKLLQSKEVDEVDSADLFAILGFPKTARFLPPDEATVVDDIPSDNKEKIRNISKVDQTLSQSSYYETTTSNFGVSSRLSYIHKHPKIEWRQDNSLILLNILATDCVDYSLQNTDSSIKIFIKYESNAYEYTVVQLYGCVEPSLMSHEQSGGKIIVRIIKSLVLTWPRLTKLNEPNRFITFNHDDLPSYLTEVAHQSKFIGVPAGYSDSDSDFEEVTSDTEL